MSKVVTYLYPNEKEASNLKMLQDTTSQIKGFYFTKENIKSIEKLPSSSNYSVYFLFDDSQSDESMVYIGQSVNGINRISEHVRTKEFWSYCIMFVTDNNSFDKLTIDYLEYKFIEKFKKSSYILTNKDLRKQEPVISIYDKSRLSSFMDQIEFLLKAEGVTIDLKRDKEANIKYYYPSPNYNAKIYIQDGKFILRSGSEIKRPSESSKNWKDNFYNRYTELIQMYIENDKIIVENGILKTKVDLEFKRPSKPAELVSGTSQNGWTFFKGLNELRKK